MLRNKRIHLGAVIALVMLGCAEDHGDSVRGYNDTPQLPGQQWRVHDMDRPRPEKVEPERYEYVEPPEDAIVLFDGTDLSQWYVRGPNGTERAPTWKVENGYFETVPDGGRLYTKEQFGDCQLHVEWMVTEGVPGQGQDKGNSGVELMTRYEIQVLESYDNVTYADGQAGAIYGTWPPTVNPARPQGEWNVYDIEFTAPRFDGEELVSPAVATVYFNGVLVQDHKEFLGYAIHRRVPHYEAHPPEQPLSLQDHNEPVRYRNIWIRRLNEDPEAGDSL